MAFFNEFPHSRTYDSDLGWLLARVKTLIDEIEALQDTTGDHTVEIADLKEKVQALFDALEEPVKPWDPTVYYRMYQTVEYNGMYYTAIKDVPAGIGVGDTNYWIPSSGVMTVVTMIQENLEQLKRDADALKESLAAETAARISNVTEINNQMNLMQYDSSDYNDILCESYGDYVKNCGSIYGIKITRKSGANPRYIIHLHVPSKPMTAPEVAKTNNFRAMIAGLIRNKYIIDGVMYGDSILNAQFWFGEGTKTGMNFREVGKDTDDELCQRYDKYGFLIWSPLITYRNRFNPSTALLNTVLSSSGNTFGDEIWFAAHPRQVFLLNNDSAGRPEIHFITFSGREYGDVGFTCPELIDYILNHYTDPYHAANMDGGGNTTLYSGIARLNPPQNANNRNTFGYLYPGLPWK